MRLSLASALRIGCGVLLIGWLLWQAAGSETLGRLKSTPPDLGWLALAWVGVLTALTLSILRWRSVVSAAGIDLSVFEALRLGALGYACNFVALGSVGGDVVKATLLAKPRPGQRAAAVTTIFVDRLFGLLGFLTYASLAVLLTGVAVAEEPSPLRLLSRSTLAAAGVAWVCFAVAMAPGRLVERLAGALKETPGVGAIAERAAEIAATYHDRRGRLIAAIVFGFAMNGTFILSFYAAAKSLPLLTPGLADHFLAVPLTAISGTLPISPNGLGTMEATAEYLYRVLSPDSPVGAGTLASLCHRLTMVAAGVCAAIFYYTTGGRRLDEEIAEAANANSAAAADEGSGTAEAF